VFLEQFGGKGLGIQRTAIFGLDGDLDFQMIRQRADRIHVARELGL
jgi:hypothetical protein